MTQTLFKLLNTTVVPLTRELAQQVCSMEGSPTEREINPKRMSFLQSKVKSGDLVPFQWATAKLGDKTFRVNGQHSSELMCNLNGEFPKDATVVLSEYEVENTEGLVLLFRQFDPKQSTRSTADIAGAYQGIEDPLRDVCKKTAKLGIDGIAWYYSKVQRIKQPTGDDRYELMGNPDHHAFLQWLSGLISFKTPELKKKPVVAAAFATFNANESAARGFWETAARPPIDGITPTAVPEILDQWLGEIAEQKCSKMSPATIYQGCIYAWNAARDSKSITIVKSDLKRGFYEPKQ